MVNTVRKTAITVAALGAFGLGGAAIAGAADTSTSSTTTRQPAQGQALSAAVAAKVEAAALDKVPGATVLRTEAGGANDAAYHAHIKTSTGALQVVLINSSFTATDVVTDQGRNGKGGGGRGGRHGNETPLTGETKTKVEAAVLAKYPGATIVRSETNNDTAAPYEAHITTTDNKQLEVTISKDFAVVDAHEHPAQR